MKIFNPESNEYKDIAKEKFVLTQTDDTISDVKFETEPIGFFKDVLIRFCKNKASVLAFIFICIIACLAIIGPGFNSYGYNDQNHERINMPPKIPFLEKYGIADGTRVIENRRIDSINDTTKYPEGSVVAILNEKEIKGVKMADLKVDYYKYVGADGEYYWLGSDYLGRDLWTRLWRGARVSLLIALISVVANVVKDWVGTATMIRTQFYRYKGSEYVLAARTLGVSDKVLIFRHILPNGIGPIITRAMIAVPSAIFQESFLAYIGLGLQAPEPSIGVLLSQGQKVLLHFPNQVLFPAILISVLMISFNMFANGLRDAFDPTQRGV